MLADCTANSVVEWLQAHPSVEIVSRDRGNVFIDGVTRGAPQAIQVADRWHLLNSLTKAVERFFLNHTQDIKAANAATEMLKRQPNKKEIERSQERTKRMVENYEQIKALHEKKVPVLHIARQLGLSRETVYRYLAKSEPPVSKLYRLK